MLSNRRIAGGKAPRQATTAQNNRLNINRIREDLESSGNMFRDMYRFKQPLTKLRVLPMPNSENFYAVRVVGFIPNGQGKTFVVSPRSVDTDAYCPLTEAYKALMAAGRTGEAEEIKPQTQYLVNAYVCEREGGNWKLEQVQMPYTVWQVIASHVSDSSDVDEQGYCVGESPVIAPDGGVVFSVRRNENPIRYVVTATPKKLPMRQQDEAKLTDFSDRCMPTSVDKIEEAICDYTGSGAIEDILSPSQTTGRARFNEFDDDAPKDSSGDYGPTAYGSNDEAAFDDADEVADAFDDSEGEPFDDVDEVPEVQAPPARMQRPSMPRQMPSRAPNNTMRVKR